MDLEVPKLTAVVQLLAASAALVGGGYTAVTKLGWLEKPILEWAPEHFEVSSGPATGDFKVTVAREKLRDDCTVEDFVLDVRDSEYIIHKGTPSITKFMGPANNRVDTFAYTFTFAEPSAVATGEATLVAYINYGCPEGPVVVTYPDHENLRFNVTEQGNG